MKKPTQTLKALNMFCYVVFITNKIWVRLGLPQELDKLKNNLLVYPCYLCYNIMDSYDCQVAHFDNVVSEMKASNHANSNV